MLDRQAKDTFGKQNDNEVAYKLGVEIVSARSTSKKTQQKWLARRLVIGIRSCAALEGTLQDDQVLLWN